MPASNRHAFTANDVEPRTGSGDHAGLDHFGVNIVNLPPGEGSAQRHWHEDEDEFVYVISGELVLLTDDGEEIMGPGDMAGFRRGVENGHHLLNRSSHDALYMEIGTRAAHDVCRYPDVDLHCVQRRNEATFTRKNGDPV